MTTATEFSTAFAMPSRWTFSIPPIADFVRRWTEGREVIVDPFCGRSKVGTHRNDLADGGVDAMEFLDGLIAQGVEADVVLFDPPYSPRQISECYRSIGRAVSAQDTQNGRLYREVRERLVRLLKPDGIALSFGWQSAGFGRGWNTLELLLVQHGGAHTDTICVAQEVPASAGRLARNGEGGVI